MLVIIAYHLASSGIASLVRLCLSLSHLELLRRSVCDEDGDAVGLGIELGEALHDQRILRVLDRLRDAPPLLAGDLERVGCGSVCGRGESLAECGNVAGLQAGD